MAGRVLTIHLVEGTATGLQTAEIDGWTGIVIVSPKTGLSTMLMHQEIKNALGVYVLIGDDPNQFGKNIIYVGQGIVTNRLNRHFNDLDKDYWDSKTLAIVAKDVSLNAFECDYLESRLIDLAKKSGLADVRNQTNPEQPILSATDKTRVENFLSQIQTLLPVLNINFFTPPPVAIARAASALVDQNGIAPLFPAILPSPRFVLDRPHYSADAELVLNSFVVLKGSTINPTEHASMGRLNSALRSQLKSSGKLVNNSESGKWEFSDDVAFTSPSSAAVVICGSSVNGRNYWKVEDSTLTYGDWDQERINAASAIAVIP